MVDSFIYELFGKTVFYLFVLILSLNLFKCLYTCFLAYRLGLGVKWRPSSDSWAIITGATDGIGLEYARSLAKMGYPLLIISRSDEKLAKVKTILLEENEKCSEIRTLVVDFTSDNIYDKIDKEIKELKTIDVLVNNVGMSFKTAEYLTGISNLKEFIPSIINCNIVSMTRMIELVLPKMVDQRRGVIINVSSISARRPVPLLSLYSASKAYCDHLSRALHHEYKDKGIVIQSVLPSFVATNMSRMKPSFTCPTAKDYVREALTTVGIENQTYGCFSHRLIGLGQDLMALWSPDLASNYLFRHLKVLRAKYYRKHNIKDK